MASAACPSAPARSTASSTPGADEDDRRAPRLPQSSRSIRIRSRPGADAARDSPAAGSRRRWAGSVRVCGTLGRAALERVRSVSAKTVGRHHDRRSAMRRTASANPAQLAADRRALGQRGVAGQGTERQPTLPLPDARQIGVAVGTDQGPGGKQAARAAAAGADRRRAAWRPRRGWTPAPGPDRRSPGWRGRTVAGPWAGSSPPGTASPAGLAPDPRWRASRRRMGAGATPAPRSRGRHPKPSTVDRRRMSNCRLRPDGDVDGRGHARWRIPSWCSSTGEGPRPAPAEHLRTAARQGAEAGTGTPLARAPTEALQSDETRCLVIQLVARYTCAWKAQLSYTDKRSETCRCPRKLGG